jgi:hypothetical protein
MPNDESGLHNFLHLLNHGDVHVLLHRDFHNLLFDLDLRHFHHFLNLLDHRHLHLRRGHFMKGLDNLNAR